MKGNGFRTVPLDLLGAVCGALQRTMPDSNTLAEVRKYTFGENSNDPSIRVFAPVADIFIIGDTPVINPNSIRSMLQDNPGAEIKEYVTLTRYQAAIVDAADPDQIARDLLRTEHAAWSAETFGEVTAVGPLLHLHKEVAELIAAPADLSEWADVFMLLWDAQRRAGISDAQITTAIRDKLAVNKLRKWGEVIDGLPVAHIAENENETVTQYRVIYPSAYTTGDSGVCINYSTSSRYYPTLAEAAHRGYAESGSDDFIVAIIDCAPDGLTLAGLCTAEGTNLPRGAEEMREIAEQTGLLFK